MFIGDGVKCIGEYAFANSKTIETVYIPDSVTLIQEGAFNGCNHLKYVYYGGTEEEWNQIIIEPKNDPLLNAKNFVYEYKFLKAASLSLDGSITVILQFGKGANAVLLNNKELTLDSEKTASFTVSPKEYKKEFTINVDGMKYVYSVSDIINAYKAKSSEFSKEINDLVNSLENYCESAYNYFYGNTVSDPGDVNTDTAFDPVISENEVPGISFYGSTLMLKSQTKIRYYFKLDSGKRISDYSFTLNGAAAEVTYHSTNLYYIETTGIPAASYSDTYTVSVKNGSGTEKTISNSVLGLCNKVLSDKSSNSNFKNLCKSIYNYYYAAKNYNG